jgi:hypothetical protein
MSDVDICFFAVDDVVVTGLALISFPSAYYAKSHAILKFSEMPMHLTNGNNNIIIDFFLTNQNHTCDAASASCRSLAALAFNASTSAFMALLLLC